MPDVLPLLVPLIEPVLCPDELPLFTEPDVPEGLVVPVTVVEPVVPVAEPVLLPVQPLLLEPDMPDGLVVSLPLIEPALPEPCIPDVEL